MHESFSQIQPTLSTIIQFVSKTISQYYNFLRPFPNNLVLYLFRFTEYDEQKTNFSHTYTRHRLMTSVEFVTEESSIKRCFSQTCKLRDHYHQYVLIGEFVQPVRCKGTAFFIPFRVPPHKSLYLLRFLLKWFGTKTLPFSLYNSLAN